MAVVLDQLIAIRVNHSLISFVITNFFLAAFYALTNPAQQITAHVYDVMRSQLPNLELDSVFEAKEELALAVKNALSDTMTTYGYSINNVLITDLDPDVRVKVSWMYFVPRLGFVAL